ncbi:SagB/ThcOx family dehydrogenase [Streptomyces sp. NPDC051453]|uniref:SagB/ThcOx family dehydrogenase n=1 Tax=Streptomyces sp. NPDC051453 TaxID=3154941 RepID=UPI00342725AA
MKVRSALDLQVQVTDGHLCLHSPREGSTYHAEVIARGALSTLLMALGDWLPFDVAAQKTADVANVSLPAAQAEVRRLIAAGLLVSDEDKSQQDLIDGAAHWGRFGWRGAFSYHALSDAIKRVDYRDQDGQRRDVALMKQYAEERPAPPIHMLDVSATRHPLPPPEKVLGTGVGDVIGYGETHTGTGLPLTAQQLSTLLWFGFGQIGSKKLPVTGEHLLKTSPSGGSRHPTEAYVLLLESDDYPLGVYHYAVRDHSLEFITAEISRNWVNRYVIGKPEWLDFTPSAVLVLTSRVELSMHRYRENYSYRPIHHDVGHLIETTGIVAEAMGCETFRGYSMDDDEVSRKIGNERLMNPTLAFMLLSR